MIRRRRAAVMSLSMAVTPCPCESSHGIRASAKSRLGGAATAEQFMIVTAVGWDDGVVAQGGASGGSAQAGRRMFAKLGRRADAGPSGPRTPPTRTAPGPAEPASGRPGSQPPFPRPAL